MVRRNDPKQILTPFGLFSYMRTYYKHKETEEYRYLVDARLESPAFSD